MITPLSKLQKEIMQEFYSMDRTKVIYNKSQRKDIWKKAVQRKGELNLKEIEIKCPALAHQIAKSNETGNNIQSAVFSECVYSQTFANMLNLKKFCNCSNGENIIPDKVNALIKSYCLYPRYVYYNENEDRMLIQAGGCSGIDSALINVIDLNIFTIEFKEPSAKTSEPDLPKYDEDGILKITPKFTEKYSQFNEMLLEHKDLNFFEVMGNNIHNFSADSVNIAVTNNYTKKYADVICTEDKEGYLVMIPANQVSEWAKIEGEIRPAGRNHYNVWTPKALNKFIKEKKGEINNNEVTLDCNQLEVRKERGGNKKISGYKINPLFFVYKSDCIKDRNFIKFNINKVQQLNPTIAGKIFFKNLYYNKVKKYYEQLF